MSLKLPVMDRTAPGIDFYARATWVKFKQTVGLPRHSDATFYIERFDRALRTGRAGKDLMIMATGRSDGAGSQAQAAMSALCMARAHGLTYVHRPFTRIEHAETDMPSWVRAWEEYFNLGAGEQRRDDATPVVSVDRLAFDALNGPAIVAAEHYLHFCNQDAEAWERVLPEMRAKFWSNKHRAARHDGEVRVAVHMRRGDVSAENKKVARNFTPNASFVTTLASLQALLAGNGVTPRIEIFSQGAPELFADLVQLGAILRLNEPAIVTHRALVEADILVMSKGAFSYTAGLLNEGITLYDAQKYRPIDSWIARAPDGSFDAARVDGRIGQLLTAR